MLIALIAAYLFAGGSFDFNQFLIDAQDAITDVVAEEDRRDSALELLAHMQDSQVQHKSDALTLIEESEAALTKASNRPLDILRPVLEAGARQRAFQSKHFIDTRFALVATLTEDEWNAVFN